MSTYIEIKSINCQPKSVHLKSIKSLAFTLSSKQFLSHNCRVVLSESAYFLECNGRFTKLSDTADGFGLNEGSIYVKKPKNELGYRVYHDTDDDIHLVGYVREEKNNIVFTTPDSRTKVIKVG